MLGNASYQALSRRRSEYAAIIQASPTLGAAGAPSPGVVPGERSTTRLTGASPPLQQPSPQTQHSPSTVEASPLQTPGPPVSNGYVEAPGRRSERGTRASIACTRCRRSKTKCDNRGVGTVCKSCEANKKVCDYQDGPATATSGGYPRRGSTVGEVDAPPKKRKRTLAPTSTATDRSLDGLRTREDILDAPWFTPKVWEELFDIYEKHFATDFPFLHRQRFLGPFHHAPPADSANVKKDYVSQPRPPHGPPLLLAFLTQTARYHPEIVSRVGNKPHATAEFFAEATRNQLRDMPGKASLERTQALLFLGFHEWTNLEGEQGWLKIRTAMSYAQVLGYQYDEQRKAPSSTDCDDDLVQQENFIDREIQRRTFWSCFIMDRYLSCGTSRPQMLAVADMDKIQLPCSDSAFSHGHKVRTRLLGENDQEYARRRQRVEDTLRRRCQENANKSPHNKSCQDDDDGGNPCDEVEWEVGKDEAELSLYIQAVNHFGKVMKWSNAGGRRCEEFAPWQAESGFKKLEDDNQRLKTALPKRLTLTPRNTDIHISFKRSRDYFLIHALHSLCTIALYREYMAFSPWNVQKPQGPLDEPKITESLPEGQPEYWIIQARRCFGAAKDFADLLKACQLSNALVDTPIAGFATYIVAWCALYCHFFPRMDPNRALNSKLQPSAWDIANTVVLDMGNRLKMASQWIDFLIRLHKFLREKRREWKAAGGSPKSTTSDGGGGLKEYSDLFESDHKEFGSLADKSWSSKSFDREDLKLQHEPELEERSEAASPSIIYKSETPSSTPRPGFNSVNSRRPTDPESVNETTTPVTHTQVPQNYGQHPNAGPMHANQGHLQQYHIIRPVRTSMVEDHGAPSGYYAEQVQVTKGPPMYAVPNPAIGNGQMPYQDTYWSQSQQPQQPALNLQHINDMESAGRPTVDMADIASFQCAESLIGNPHFFGNYVSDNWTEQIPLLHEGQLVPTTWSAPPYEADYSNMTSK